MVKKYRSDKVKAEAIEMVRQGETLPAVAEKLNVVPRTARYWVQQARAEAEAENRDPMLTDGSYRLAFLGQKIQQSQLEEMVQMIAGMPCGEHSSTEAECSDCVNPQSTLRHALVTNVITGTHIDKLRKRDSAAQVSVQFNFYSDD